MTLTSQEGVFYYTFRKLDIIDRSETSMNIHVYSPYTEFIEPDGRNVRQKGELFGCPIEWHIVEKDGGSYHACTCIEIEKDAEPDNNVQYYIMANYYDKKDWNTMLDMVEML